MRVLTGTKDTYIGKMSEIKDLFNGLKINDTYGIIVIKGFATSEKFTVYDYATEKFVDITDVAQCTSNHICKIDTFVKLGIYKDNLNTEVVFQIPDEYGNIVLVRMDILD